MLILPAIDLRAGRVVRLAQGDFGRETVYGDDPVSVARGFVNLGAGWIHVVDLDGSRAGGPVHWGEIAEIAKTGARVEFGGGVRSLEIAHRLLDIGVTRVVVGTQLVQDPERASLLFTELGEAVVAGIDARDGRVAISGWEESVQVSAVDLAVRIAGEGAKRVILTDIARDGMLAGPNLRLLAQVKAACGLPVIHSGGIGSLDHLRTLAALGDDAPEGVILGRAIYEGSIRLEDALAL